MVRPGDDGQRLRRPGAKGTPMLPGRYLGLLVIFAVVAPGPAGAASCRHGEAALLAAELATHFEAGTLRDLAAGLARRPLVLRIESSLEGTVQRQSLPGLAEMEAAIRRDERAERRLRGTLGPATCRGGVCRYGPSQGILHNHLYLKEATIQRREGCLVVTGILLLDGD